MFILKENTDVLYIYVNLGKDTHTLRKHIPLGYDLSPTQL